MAFWQEEKQQQCSCPKCPKPTFKPNPPSNQDKTIHGSRVTVRIRTSKFLYTLRNKFSKSHTVHDIKRAYLDEFGDGSNVDEMSLPLQFRRKVLEPDNASLSRFITSERSITLRLSCKVVGGGLIGVKYDKSSNKLQIGYDQHGSNTFEIPSFHVSCKSDKYTGEDMTGIVLYQYDGKIDWRLNGVHCKSGYIVLKLTKNISHIKGEIGMVHGACYKWIFDQSVDNKVVGGGFAYYQNKWKFKSGVFNVGSKYHDDKREMHPTEKACIRAAIENWKKGVQNTYVKDIANKYKGCCGDHGFY